MDAKLRSIACEETDYFEWRAKEAARERACNASRPYLLLSFAFPFLCRSRDFLRSLLPGYGPGKDKWVHPTGRQEEEDGKTLARDKRDGANTCVLCRDLHLNLCFLVFYKKIYLKESEVWRKVISNKIVYQGFGVFFALPCCCVSSLIKEHHLRIAIRLGKRLFPRASVCALVTLLLF